MMLVGLMAVAIIGLVAEVMAHYTLGLAAGDDDPPSRPAARPCA
jgi:hypothetical protein